MSKRFILFLLEIALPFFSISQVSSVQLMVHVPAVQNKNVYVSGSFNNWKAGDSLYKMKRVDANTYSITLPVFKDVHYQYKYTLGEWSNVEIALNDSNIKTGHLFLQQKRKKSMTQSQNGQRLRLLQV
jgi:hypothetical protein